MSSPAWRMSCGEPARDRRELEPVDQREQGHVHPEPSDREDDVRHRDVPLAQQSHVDDRLVLLLGPAPLPKDERDEEGEADAEEPEGQRRGPSPRLALRECRHHPGEGAPEERRADVIDPGARSPVRRLPHEEEDRNREDEDDRDRRVVGVPPPVVLGDERADGEADGEPDPEESAEEALGPRNELPRELLPHERHPEREDREADPLDRPGGDHELEVRGEPGDRDGCRVGEHGPHEDLPLSVDVPELADDGAEGDARDRVRRDDQRHLGGVDMEVALDRREGRREHPLDVEDRHHDPAEEQHHLVRVRPVERRHRLRERLRGEPRGSAAVRALPPHPRVRAEESRERFGSFVNFMGPVGRLSVVARIPGKPAGPGSSGHGGTRPTNGTGGGKLMKIARDRRRAPAAEAPTWRPLAVDGRIRSGAASPRSPGRSPRGPRGCGRTHPSR